MAETTIFVLDPYHPDAIEHLSKAPVKLVLNTDPRRDQWYNEADGILIRSESRITAQDFAKATKLKVIVKQGTGVDNVDLAAAKEAGVIVCNTPAMNSEAVAELTLSLALCLARRVTELDRQLRRGEKIVRSKMLGQSLFEKTIGIVGMGNIGHVVAQKWIGAMSGQIIAYDPFAPEGAWKETTHTRVHDINELLEKSDVISLHVPLTNGTRNMIADKQLKLMKSNAILLNCSRGGIVDEAALSHALSEKLIFGAALDATEVEPPTLETHKALLSNENIILTPHVGASTRENQSKSGVVAAQIILDVCAGTEVSSRIV